MRKKISDKVATASRNDAAPILGVCLELVSLERIDLIADDASDGHECPSGGRSAGESPKPRVSTPAAVGTMPRLLRGGRSARLRALSDAYLARCHLPDMNTSSTIKVWMSSATLTLRFQKLLLPSVSRHAPACSTAWWTAVRERAPSLR